MFVSWLRAEDRMRGFGELEAAVMDRLWSWERPASVREVLDDLRKERDLREANLQADH